MDDEARENWRLVLTPAGEEWSGRTRYAAAMYFFRAGEMSAEVLEIYRICSRLDGEDAVDALRAYRMGEEWIAKVEKVRKELGLPPSALPGISPTRGESG
jgi:Mor family transcriptional regulator